MASCWLVVPLRRIKNVGVLWQIRSLSSTPAFAKKNKVFPSSAAAVADIPNGSSIFIGGFGPCGLPENLLNAVRDTNVKDLHCVSNNPGLGPVGMSKLLLNEQVKSVITSYPGPNTDILDRLYKGKIRLEVMPQGTLVEKIRAAGAGIAAFYTRAGTDTYVHHGKLAVRYNPDGSVAEYSQKKESKVFNGKEYILEEGMSADYALVKAWKGDRLGNLVFRGTARNFNPDMAKAAKVCIAEVEELVEPGDLKPEEIHLPGIFVTRILKGEAYSRRVWKLAAADDDADLTAYLNQFEASMDLKRDARDRIARRCALEFRDGDCVNLGIGIPDYAANFIPEGMDILLHSENGLLGMGPDPSEEEEDPDLLNASKGPVSYMKGSSVFSSSDSFGIMRGGHLDLSIMGALQVSAKGDLANWCIPGKMMKGIGGAMDLVAGVDRIVIALTHCARDGKSKIVEDCTLPLTGRAVADMIITELAVFKVKRDGSGLVLLEHAKDTTVEEIRKKTAAKFEVSPNLKVIEYAEMSKTHAAAAAAKKAAPKPAAEEGPADLETLFQKLKQHPDYPTLKGMLKGAMGSMVLPTVLPIIAKQSPALAKAIKEDKKKFLKLVNES